MSQVVQDIARMLEDYFDGWHFAEAERLRRVFHPECRLQCLIDGALDIDDMEKVYRSVASRVSPSARGEARRDEVIAIDVASPHSAMAKVRLAIGRKLFTDYLSLLKIDGRWLIVSKVFSFVEMADA